MFATAPLVVLAVATAQIVSAAGFTAGPDFTYAAFPGSKTEVCVSGSVPTNTYIGFGIPAFPANPVMSGASLILVYAGNDNVATVRSGRASGHSLIVDPSVATLVASKSSYSGGVLKVCVEVSADLVPTGSSTYLWATGRVENGNPVHHVDRGSVTAELYAAAAAAAPSPAGPIPPSTASSTTTAPRSTTTVAKTSAPASGAFTVQNYFAGVIGAVIGGAFLL